VIRDIVSKSNTTPTLAHSEQAHCAILRKLQFGCAAFTVALSSSVLVGWATGSEALKSIIPGLTAMNPLTAVCFLACAGSLSLTVAGRAPVIASSLAGFVLVAAAIRVIAYVAGVEAGIDRLLFGAALDAEPIPNRMAPNTACAFVALGLGLLTSRANWPRFRPDLYFSAIALLIGFLALTGYAFNVLAASQVAEHIAMALGSALLFAVNGFAALLIRSDCGFVAPMVSGLSGFFARRALAASAGIPFLLGLICLRLEETEVISSRFANALTVAGTITLMAASAAVAASRLSEADRARREAEAETLEANRKLLGWNEDLTASVAERTRELKAAQEEILERLGRAASYRDNDTGWHVERMSRYCEVIARQLGIPEDECRLIRQAAPMHDIGKIGVSDTVLLKPGKLTESEWKQVKQHVGIGADLLSGGSTELMKLAEMIALTHHERWDGSGYPRGLKGEEIPLVGRIAAVADVFDALTSERPYKSAWSVADAVAEIESKSGVDFDPSVVAAFLSCLPQILAIKEEYAEVQDSSRQAA
jgi:HD-GYP domain-containing protein (c-di-GMP phosphodiesterase class II)